MTSYSIVVTCRRAASTNALCIVVDIIRESMWSLARVLLASCTSSVTTQKRRRAPIARFVTNEMLLGASCQLLLLH